MEHLEETRKLYRYIKNKDKEKAVREIYRAKNREKILERKKKNTASKKYH